MSRRDRSHVPSNGNSQSGQTNQPPAQHAPKEKLTSASFLTLSRVVAFGAAFSAGLAVCLGSYADITASDGPANFILPFVIAVVVAGGLAAGWHVVLGMAAESETPPQKSVAAVIGVGLVIIGLATASWFLAAKIGGGSAIQKHQSEYLHELQKADRLAAENAAKEIEVLQATKSGAESIDAMAESEGKFGTYTETPGFKGVYQAIKDVADSVLRKHGDLRKLDDTRRRKLASARREIDNAAKAVTNHTTDTFKDSSSRAASLIAEADRIRLSALASGLTLGSAPGDAGRDIRTIGDSISEAARDVEARLQPVSIPAYVPMDAKTAVVTYPEPLPWLMAILIEFLPLIMLGLLLGLPRAGKEN